MATKSSKKSIVFLIIASVISVLFVALAAFNITLAVKFQTAPQSLPSVFGAAPIVIDSDTLSPVVNRNDLVFVRTSEAAKSSAEFGDFVAFRFEGVLLIEPVIGEEFSSAEETLYILQNSTELDKAFFSVNERDILGVYSRRIPKVGAVFSFMQSSVGIAVLLLVSTALYFIYFFALGKNKSKKLKSKHKTKSRRLEKKMFQFKS